MSNWLLGIPVLGARHLHTIAYTALDTGLITFLAYNTESNCLMTKCSCTSNAIKQLDVKLFMPQHQGEELGGDAAESHAKGGTSHTDSLGSFFLFCEHLCPPGV